MKMANQRVDSTGKVGAVFSFTGGIIKLSFPKCSLTFPVGHAKRWATIMHRNIKQIALRNANFFLFICSAI
jgi:hypothetical protein